MSGYDIHTLEQVGEAFNITRERVRQIERKKLWQNLEKNTTKNLAIVYMLNNQEDFT